MKNSLKNILVALPVILLFIAGNVQAQSSKPNFTGSWKINLEKSDFGTVPTFTMHAQMILQQQPDSIAVKASGTGNDGKPYSGNAKYALNGTATVRELPDNKKLIGLMKWSDNGTGIIKDQKYISSDKPEEPYREIKESWALSSDGNTLTIQQHVEIAEHPDFSYSIKAVFDKQ
jgi:hypothetical protein